MSLSINLIASMNDLRTSTTKYMFPVVVTALIATTFGATGCPSSTGGSDGGPSPDPVAALVINEVMAANTSTLADDLGEFDDWIELKNESAQAISLVGFSITDDVLEPDKFVFSATTPEVPANGYLILFADKDDTQGPIHLDFKLSKNGEGVFLYDVGGRLVSEISFGTQFDDISFGRPNDDDVDPAYLLTATPGAENTGARTSIPDGGPPLPVDAGVDAGTDAGPLPPSAGDVVINEVVAVNVNGLQDQTSTSKPWLELFNAGAAVSLEGHALKDDRALAMRWIFPVDTTLEAGEWRIFFADGAPDLGANHADVDLLPAGGQLSLIAPDESVIDNVTYPALGEDIAWARVPNGTGDFSETTPTPNATNGDVDAGPLADAGSDAGSDAGVDAGLDAGVDAGLDAGNTDSGTDAG